MRQLITLLINNHRSPELPELRMLLHEQQETNRLLKILIEQQQESGEEDQMWRSESEVITVSAAMIAFYFAMITFAVAILSFSSVQGTSWKSSGIMGFAAISVIAVAFTGMLYYAFQAMKYRSARKDRGLTKPHGPF